MNAFGKVPLAKTLRGGFQFQHVLPVRAHPDKNRKRERNGDKGHQRHVQQTHLVQIIEIGHRPDGQHVMAARNALDKGVFLIQRDDVPVAQTLHSGRIQIEIFQRLDA